MKINDAFPSNWLKAADFEDAPRALQIFAADFEDVKTQQGTERKLVLRFRGTDKGLIVNKTNGTTIAKLYGDETDDWPGRWITLYATDVQFGGEMVRSIRVSSKVPRGNAPAPAPPAPARALAAAPADSDDSDGKDDIPF